MAPFSQCFPFSCLFLSLSLVVVVQVWFSCCFFHACMIPSIRPPILRYIVRWNERRMHLLDEKRKKIFEFFRFPTAIAIGRKVINDSMDSCGWFRAVRLSSAHSLLAKTQTSKVKSCRSSIIVRHPSTFFLVDPISSPRIRI